MVLYFREQNITCLIYDGTETNGTLTYISALHHTCYVNWAGPPRENLAQKNLGPLIV